MEKRPDVEILRLLEKTTKEMATSKRNLDERLRTLNVLAAYRVLTARESSSTESATKI